MNKTKLTLASNYPQAGTTLRGYSDLINAIEDAFTASDFHNSLLSTWDHLGSLKRFTGPTSYAGLLDSNYPPYNLHVEDEGKTYTIEFALSGFSKNDISVLVEDNILTISGGMERIVEKTGSDESTSMIDAQAPPTRYTYHQGIASRSFKKSFTLPEYAEVKDVVLENGLLTIKIVKEIPEAKKPRVLQIR